MNTNYAPGTLLLDQDTKEYYLKTETNNLYHMDEYTAINIFTGELVYLGGRNVLRVQWYEVMF